MSGSRAWLNRNVAAMGATSLLSDASHETATAVLPGFLAALGLPPAALGLIKGFSDALASFLKLGAGWLGNRTGHRWGLAVAGYTLTCLMPLAFIFATSWPMVFAGKLLGWTGKGIRGPLRDAILAESVPPEARGRAFGFHRAGDTIGAVVGHPMRMGPGPDGPCRRRADATRCGRQRRLPLGLWAGAGGTGRARRERGRTGHRIQARFRA